MALSIIGIFAFSGMLSSHLPYEKQGEDMADYSSGSEETAIHWMTLEEAVEAQKKNPKKIIMDIYTDWCGPCKMLDKNTFHHPQVAAYISEHYYAVKFNAEGNDTIHFKGNTFTNPGYDPARKGRRNSGHQLAGYFRVRGYPTIMFLDENGDVITPLVGYYTPKNLEIYLKLFASNAYKNIKTKEEWEAYQKEFKYEFE